MRSLSVFLNKGINAQRAYIWQGSGISLARPVPPGYRLQGIRLRLCKTTFEGFGRDAAHNSVGLHILCYHSTSPDDGTRAHGDAWRHSRPVANPNIVAKGDPMLLPPFKEGLIIVAQPIGLRAIDRMML